MADDLSQYGTISGNDLSKYGVIGGPPIAKAPIPKELEAHFKPMTNPITGTSVNVDISKPPSYDPTLGQVMPFVTGTAESMGDTMVGKILSHPKIVDAVKEYVANRAKAISGYNAIKGFSKLADTISDVVEDVAKPPIPMDAVTGEAVQPMTEGGDLVNTEFRTPPARAPRGPSLPADIAEQRAMAADAMHGGVENTPIPGQPIAHPPFAETIHKSPATVARQLKGIGTLAEGLQGVSADSPLLKNPKALKLAQELADELAAGGNK